MLADFHSCPYLHDAVCKHSLTISRAAVKSGKVWRTFHVVTAAQANMLPAKAIPRFLPTRRGIQFSQRFPACVTRALAIIFQATTHNSFTAPSRPLVATHQSVRLCGWGLRHIQTSKQVYAFAEHERAVKSFCSDGLKSHMDLYTLHHNVMCVVPEKTTSC